MVCIMSVKIIFAYNLIYLTLCTTAVMAAIRSVLVDFECTGKYDRAFATYVPT